MSAEEKTETKVEEAADNKVEEASETKAEATETKAEATETKAEVAETKTEEVADTPAPAAPVRKPKRALWKRVLSNPLFWLFVAIALLIGSIEYFERYTQVGINNTYKIF